MKARLLSLLALATLLATQLHASPNGGRVPDSGSTVGLLAVGVVAALALRRRSK